MEHNHGHEHHKTHSSQDMPLEHNHSATDHHHGGHMGHVDGFKKKFFISLALSVPIFLLSPMMGINLPFQVEFTGSQWIVLVLSTILFFMGACPFYPAPRKSSKGKLPL